MFTSSRHFGVDISASAIKVIESNKDGIITSLWTHEFDEAFFDLSKRKKREFVKKELVEYFSQINVKKGILFFTIPSNTLFTRLVKLPRVESNKIPQMVQFEAEQQVPFDISDVVWDYTIYTNDPSEEYLEIGLSAVKKEILEDYLFYGDIKGFEISLISTNAYSLHCASGLFDQNALLIDIGKHSTEFVIVDSKRIWSRTILHGGEDINYHIFSSLNAIDKNIQTDQVETIKKNAHIGMKDAGKLSTSYHASKSIKKTVDLIISEIKQSLNFYLSQHKKENIIIKKIYMSGGGSMLGGIKDYIGEKMSMDVAQIDIRQHMLESLKNKADSESAARLIVAYGLSLLGLRKKKDHINLLPKPLQKQNFVLKCFPVVYTALAVLSIIFIISKFAVVSTYSDKIDFLKKLKDSQSVYNALIVKQAKILKVRNAIKVDIDQLYKHYRFKHLWLNALNYISEALPQEAWITRIDSQDEKSFYIEGSVDGSFTAIDKFARNVQEFEYFKKAEIEKATVATVEEKRYKNFKIKITLTD